MSYIGPIQYGPHPQLLERTSAALMLAFFFAASIFVALLLVTASIAVKFDANQPEAATAGP